MSDLCFRVCVFPRQLRSCLREIGDRVTPINFVVTEFQKRGISECPGTAGMPRNEREYRVIFRDKIGH